MATYLDIDNLTTLIPEDVIMQLTDDNSTCAIDLTTVEEILQEACETVDGYLRGRYGSNMPFVNVPTLVVGYAKKLARYELYNRRPEGFELPPAVVNDRKFTIKELEKVRDGKVSLAIEGTGETINEDGEFAVRVRPSRTNNSGLSFEEAIDQW